MARPVAAWTESFRRQVEQISAALSEGVILIDVDQTIRWANTAALAMHGVDKAEDLGRTMVEYHARFQIKYRNLTLSARRQGAGATVADQAFGDLVIEVTPLAGYGPSWHHRMRNLVLSDDTGMPACIAVILQPLNNTQPIDGRFFSSRLAVAQPAAILRLSDQTFIDANSAMLQLLGGQREDVVTRSLDSIDMLRDSTDLCSTLKHIIVTNQPATAPTYLKDADGSNNPIVVIALPIEFEAGAGMLITFAQQTASEQLSAARGNSAALEPNAAALCAAAPVALVALDTEMRITHASDAWMRWLEYRREGVIGHKITEFQAPPSAERFSNCVWGALLDSGSAREMECRFVKRSGEIVDAQISLLASLDDSKGFRFATLAANEITDLKRQEERFAKMFGASPVPLIVAKLDDSRVLDVNEAFLAATGHDQRSVIGHRVDEMGLFETRGLRHQYEEDLRKTGQVRRMDVKVRSAAAGLLDCILSADTVWAFGQKCALITLQDVTERRMNEAQLLQAIEAVMKDTSWFSRSVVEKLALIRSPAKPGARTAEIGHLTKREHEVLVLISHGLTDSDIAAKLGLTRCTVRNHVATLYGKIDVHSRSSAIVWARERGLNLTLPQVTATARPALQVAPKLPNGTRRLNW